MRARRWLLTYVCTSSLATVAAIGLHLTSLDRVRQLLPDYPGSMSVGMYRPLPPVEFLHVAGVPTLTVLGGIAVIATVLLSWSRHAVSNRLAVASGGAHLTALALGLLCYGWCLFRIWRILQQFT